MARHHSGIVDTGAVGGRVEERRSVSRRQFLIYGGAVAGTGLIAYLAYRSGLLGLLTQNPEQKVVVPHIRSTSTPEPTATPEARDMLAYLQEELGRAIPDLTGYPRALRVAASQAYKQGLHDLKIYLPDKEVRKVSLEEYLFPAVEFPVRLQVDRKIDALNGWNLADKSLEDEAIGQVLLPVELMLSNIRTGEWWMSGINYHRTEQDRINIGISNVTHSPELNGLSPQEWLREISVRDYQDKNSKGYQMALGYSLASSETNDKTWPNSIRLYITKGSEMLKDGDDLPIFIKGYPLGLRHMGIITYEPGFDTAPYAVLVGKSFGRPVFVVDANYTRARHETLGTPITHNSAYILTQEKKFFGEWIDKEVFLKDFEEAGINPPGIRPEIYDTPPIGITSFIPFRTP